MNRPWRIVSASAAGTSHSTTGTPCQDSAAQAIIETQQGPILISVVCDGAGSAAHSDIGSSLAAAHFVDLAAAYLTSGGEIPAISRPLVQSWISEIADRLTVTATKAGHHPKDYSSTLLGAVIGPDAAIFAQIGDGAMVVSHGPGDGWSWVFWPQRGEYANQTVFVLSDNALEAMQFDLAPHTIDEIALFSDGIEHLVIDKAAKTVNEAFFDAMSAPIRTSTKTGLDTDLSEKLKIYLDSAAINTRTSDDKTLVLASRSTPAGTPSCRLE